jgi:hypothetical protein
LCDSFYHHHKKPEKNPKKICKKPSKILKKSHKNSFAAITERFTRYESTLKLFFVPLKSLRTLTMVVFYLVRDGGEGLKKEQTKTTTIYFAHAHAVQNL